MGLYVVCNCAYVASGMHGWVGLEIVNASADHQKQNSRTKERRFHLPLSNSYSVTMIFLVGESHALNQSPLHMWLLFM